MLDIKFIRENGELVREAARKKQLDFKVEELLTVDERRLALLAAVEQMRGEQNRASSEVVNASSPEVKQKLLETLKILKANLQAKEKELGEVMKSWQKLMLQVPNVPDVSVPEGKSDVDNKEVRTWGEIPEFKFEPKSHVDLMQTLDLADLTRGAKVAGFRGYFLKNDAVLLSYALWRYTLDYFIKAKFTPMMVPALLKKEAFLGTGYLPQGEEDLYKTADGDYLAGTAEVGIMSYFSDEIIPAAELPKKFIAFSPCFRREAGSHGKDTKGLIRVHEFFKWEQVVLGEASHEQSVDWHEELTTHAENLLQALKLPYRVVVNCGGDLGLGQVKKYDLEVWLPSEQKYRETHSSSYFHDFQTRRLNIRYRDETGKLQFAHSLNNTAVATPRLLAAIIENYQTTDGQIKIPDALISLMGKEVIS